MGSGIYIATAGARSQSDALDVIANNVANANTVGYQAERVSFGEALATAQSPDARYVGVAGTHSDATPGALEQTGNPLDLALVGDGYFAIQTDRGVRYTRAGNFQIDASNRIVSASGHPAVSATGAPIVVPPDAAEIKVDADGTVRADGVDLGRIRVARFAPTALSREGDSLYAAAGAPVTGGEEPTIVAGTLEKSNVNVVRGVVDLVKVSRTYQALMSAIENYKQIDSQTAQKLGGR